MEETKFSIMANNYFMKWRTAEETIKTQCEAITELGDECTQLRRENYSLRDALNERARATANTNI